MRCVLLALLLTSCGYGWVRSDGAPVRLGVVQDLSAEGDLGLVAGRVLRRALAGRLGEGPVVTGELRTTDETLAAFDGAPAMYRVGVRLELRVLGGGGVVLWESGPATRHEVYARGPSPFDSLEARRLALRRATEAAAEDCAARLGTYSGGSA